MGYAMTFAALRELRMDSGRMRCAMAILALGHVLVLVRVTECTGKLVVLRSACRKQIECPLVAGAA